MNTEISDTILSDNNGDSDTVFPQGSHVNFMGAPSYKIGSALTTLEIMGASSFFGEPKYYGDGAPANREVFRKLPDSTCQLVLGKLFCRLDRNPSHSMEVAIDAALDEDPEGTLQIAVRLRKLDHMRKTPQVILVRASKHPKVVGTKLIATYAPFILGRADELGTQKEYHDAVYGKKKYPAALKRFWGASLEKMSRYALAKYKAKGSLVDVVNISHPKGNDNLKDLVKGTLSLSGGEDMETWESLISREGSSKETWTKAIEVMGHMALLRNLRNFQTHKVAESLYLPKLVATAAEGKQFPFRYVAAYRAVGAQSASAAVRQALDECLKESLKLTPTFKGNVLSLCDNSGSASMTLSANTRSDLKGRKSEFLEMRVADVANISAVIAAMSAEGKGVVGVFGDRLKTLAIDRSVSVLDQNQAVQTLGGTVGGSTEHGIWVALDRAIKEKQHWDHIFVYSDMQCGHGGLYGTNIPHQDRIGARNVDVPSMINRYRETVNPKVNVYLVQVAGYSDTIIPEVFPRVAILGGWGDGVLRYADRMRTIWDGLEAQAENTAT